MNTLKFKLLFVLSIIVLSISCYAQLECKPLNLTKKQKEWFLGKTWLQDINGMYDSSLDVETFVKHYQKHPERWNKVFKFIHDNDLASLPLGKQLLGDDVSYNVQEYTTREPGKELLEGHKKYIDLQYVVSGTELHGCAKISEISETPNLYSEKNDVALYKVPAITYHVIRPNNFTIFFPNNIHITNIQYGEKAPVRKVVFKIQVD